MAGTIFDPTEVSTKAEFALHSFGRHDGTKGYVYIKANGAISVGAVCVIPINGEADELDAGNVATNNGLPLGVAQTAIANDSYGWLQVSGPCGAIQVSGTVTAGDYLWATTTDGALDDADVANANIHGIAVAARTGAGNTSGILTFPTIQGDN